MKPSTKDLNIVPLQAPAPLVVAVEFGQRLANGQCGHIGICNIADASLPGSAPYPRRRRCRQALAQLSVGGEGRAVLLFPYDKMLPCTARAFFRRPLFGMPISVELPVLWQEHLPELREFTLPAGQYPIWLTETGYLIRF